MKEVFIFETVKSGTLKGRRTISPKIAEYKIDIKAEVFVIAHLQQIVYIPQTHTAVIIHKSPVLKSKGKQVSLLYLLIVQVLHQKVKKSSKKFVAN